MDYATNPLNTNVIFNLGQPVIIILAVFAAAAGLLTFIGRVADLPALDIHGGRWLERFILFLLYAVLTWLGLTMIISYIGSSVLDIINGAVLLLGVVVSLIRRATSDQIGANRTLAFAYGFFAALLVWHLIYGAINGAIPPSVSEVVDNFHANFFTDLFQFWHWG